MSKNHREVGAHGWKAGKEANSSTFSYYIGTVKSGKTCLALLVNHAALSSEKEAIQSTQTQSKTVQKLSRFYECTYTDEYIYKTLGAFWM